MLKIVKSLAEKCGFESGSNPDEDDMWLIAVLTLCKYTYAITADHDITKYKEFFLNEYSVCVINHNDAAGYSVSKK